MGEFEPFCGELSTSDNKNLGYDKKYPSVPLTKESI